MSTLPAPRGALLAVMLGGLLGALARWQLQEAWPATPGTIPWTVLAINVTGSAAMGLLMAWVGTGRAPALARPFLGVGVLGGFTTFSAFAVDVVALTDAGHALIALTYLVLTVVTAMAAVIVGDALGRRLVTGATGTGVSR